MAAKIIAAVFTAIFSIFSPVAGPSNSEPKLEPAQKQVFLTFDADMTEGMFQQAVNGKLWFDPQLFDFLLEQKIPATIFVSGLFVQAYPDLVKKLSASKMINFGNHSFDHKAFIDNCYKLKSLKGMEEKIEEVEKAQKVIFEKTGRTSKFFRFPGLCSSQSDKNLVKSLGLEISEPQIISGDAFNFNPEKITANVLANIKPGDVILFHVGGPNAPKDTEAVKNVVKELEKQGYQFSLDF